MQRRNFLQLLSTLPFLGWLSPKPTEYKIGVDVAGGKDWVTIFSVTDLNSDPPTITEYVLNEAGEFRELYSNAIPPEQIYLGLASDSAVIAFKDFETPTNPEV